MLQILTAISPLFLIILASALIVKFGKIGEDWTKVLNEFALKIGLPAMIFSVLAKTSFSFQEQAPLIITNSAFIITSFILAIIIGKALKLKERMFQTIFICFVFGNIAYLGIPVLTQVSGESILPTVSIIIALYLIWISIIGISYLDYAKTKNKKNILGKILKTFTTNPLIVAVFLGLLIGSLHIKLPAILMTSLNMLSASVTPTVLVVIGLFIGTSKIGKLKEWIPVLIFTIFTLAILPAGLYFGIKLFGQSTSLLSSSIIEAAMPLAITPFALADNYKLDKKFIARTIVLSTILSAISLPIWISIL